MTVEMLKDNIPHPDIDVPGPDMGTDARIMFWMLIKACEMAHFRSVPNSLALVTGKPLEDGGVPGRVEATARGALIQTNSFRELSKIKMPATPSLVVQGFGNVGGNIASLIHDNPKTFCYKITAISDVVGGVYNKKGLDISAVIKWHEKNGSFAGYKEGDAVSNEELLLLPTDILIPAAIENQITEKNAASIKAKLVVEAANEAITAEANEILFDSRIPIIPGIS